ncbi:hypothetical protein PtA15_13A193 [Puccinia triticina]|uniref:Uncharacterized protein n=1 Tax=Puccinia triticina TaxID=208348 RepID=A0ABY7CZN5_9BASI|nr:uncharacterized protein PtA15_13A193 [Puccinia triticina]WAQ90794.1 hypothetical protein PtA15_13A193 [Puccinia triticina]
MVLPPSTFAASSSTPSTGTCNRKKAILEPVCPHHRLPFAFAARLYLSRANQPWDDPNSEDEEYLRALDEAWEAFEAELDLKYGTGPYQININSQYQESLKDEMTDSASPATPTPASTS